MFILDGGARFVIPRTELTFPAHNMRLHQNAADPVKAPVDVVMADFDADLEGNLQKLAEALKSGSFEARPVRRVYIPKANGKKRPLGIPSVRDRIVQEAVRMILEPIFEANFLQDSYGFRPNRRTMDAVKLQNYRSFLGRLGDAIRQQLTLLDHARAEYEQAKAELDRAIAINPSDAHALAGRGNILGLDLDDLQRQVGHELLGRAIGDDATAVKYRQRVTALLSKAS